jgi:sulfur-oxidizing protein SoxZ
LAFSIVATESGTITFEWTDDKGETHTASAEITVT